MARPIPALRRLLRHRFFSSPPPIAAVLRPPPPPPLNSFTFHSKSHFNSSHFFYRFFSSQPVKTPIDDETLIAKSISAELLKFTEFETLTIPQRLDLSFSHINITPSLVLHTLNASPDAGRSVFDFLNWASPKLEVTDEVYSYFVDYFGRRKDFKAIHDVLVKGKEVVGVESFRVCVDRMVRAGRGKEAVALFDRMEKDYGFSKDRVSMEFIVGKLCEKGFAGLAEKMVKGLADEFFPGDGICDVLIKGWCVDGKLDEARRLAREMYRGGFEIGTNGYNAILDCVCRLCREKDPFRVQEEAEKVLVDMEAAGVLRNVETFNVMISNLCKIRKTEDAMKLFFRMGEWGCYPDATTFLVLIRSLYQAARVAEGDEMIDRMKSAGFGDALDKKAYYGFIKILCGIERIEHALSVLKMMKNDGCKPGMKTYDLLMGKFCVHGRVDKANALFHEARQKGLPVEPKEYKLDPRFMKKPEPVKKGKKRLTLPEKMALKRKRLRKVHLSFVKKPKKMMRRMY
ncbi:hypothetical protein Droror1_Dr00004476 [Drosera rotundifolia]